MTSLPGGLEAFDPASVRRGAAALALWTPNADRMRALAELARTLPAIDGDPSRPPITADDWRAWLASDDSRAIRDTVPNGLFDAPSLAEVELLGTRYRLLAGYLDMPDVPIRVWARAIVMAATDGSDPHLARALATLMSAAAVSELVVRHGPTELSLPDHRLDGEIGVPDDLAYALLYRAVGIEERELAGDLVALDHLRPLTATTATPAAERWRTPLVAEADGVVLASPPDLLLAALMHAVETALESPSWDSLLWHVYREAGAVLRRVAADMDWAVEDGDGADWLLRFDADKLAAIELLIAPITPFGEQTARAGVDVQMAFERLEARRASTPGVEVGLLVVVGDGRAVEYPAPQATEPPFGPWVLQLADLRLLGDALRLQPLRLWRLLRDVGPPPWPGDMTLLDVLGTAWLGEESITGLPPVGREHGGTEHLHRQALFMACRHAAPGPDGDPWVTVSRWRGTPDPAIFAAEQDGGPHAVLARGPRRFCWVVADGDVESEADLLAVLVRLVSFWAARMLAEDWLVVPEEDDLGPLDTLEVMVRLDVAFEDAAGPALAIAGEPGRGRIVAGPAFVHAMARGDNVADRMVVAALARWWQEPLGLDHGALLERVAREGHGTLLIWPDPEARTADVLAPAEPVPRSEVRRVAADVGEAFGIATQLLVAQDVQAAEILERVNALVVELLDDEIDACSPEVLLELVRMHEHVGRHQEADAVGAPITAAMPAAGWLADALDSETLGALGLRWLIERFSARPPEGKAVYSRALLDRLRALADRLIDWGGSWDAVRAELGTVTVTMAPFVGCVVLLDGPVVLARETVHGLMSDAAARRSLELRAEWWAPDEPLPFDVRLDERREPADALELAVDRAMEATWGYTLDELTRTLAALMGRAADASDNTAVDHRAAVEEAVLAETSIDAERVATIVDSLVLGPCEPYDPLSREHKGWSTNRDRSYLRRPLVALADGRLAWSAAHVLSVGRYLSSLIASGRLRAGGELGRAVKAYSAAADRAFEDVVGGECGKRGWRVLMRRDKIGGVRLERVPGQPIGDIDVLAYRPEIGRVWLLDAKRIAPALVPNQMRREARDLARSVAKHVERLEWVRAHPELLAKEIGDPMGLGAWSVDAALVSDLPLAGAYLEELELPVWSRDEVGDRLGR